MALNLNFGGDNEYVAMAQRAAEESKGPSIIASLLDAVGLGRQVAKGPKPTDLADGQTPEGKANTQQKKLENAQSQSKDPVVLSAIAEAETALGVTPLPTTQAIQPSRLSGTAPETFGGPVTRVGRDFLDGLKPLTTIIPIDPDVGMLGIPRW